MIRWACGGVLAVLAAAVGLPFPGTAAGQPPPPLPPGMRFERPGSQPGQPRPIRPAALVPAGPAKLDRFGDPLPPGAIARLGTIRLRHGGDIEEFTFSPDGKFLATVSVTEVGVRLWDPKTGKELGRLETPALCVGITRDGSVLVADDTRAKVWTPATNTVRDLPDDCLPPGTTAVAVHPDGRTFAAAAQKKLLILDLQTGKPRAELKLPGEQPPVHMAYSPDGRWLAATGVKTGVWLWDTKTNKRVRTYRSEMETCAFAFSADGSKIAVTDNVLRVYPTDSEESDDDYSPPENQVVTVRFSPDGKWVFGQERDGTVIQVDAATGRVKESWNPPDEQVRPPFALSPDGAVAAGTDDTGGIRLWDPKTGDGPDVERLPMLYDPGFSADGKTASCLDQLSRLHTFDPLTGQPGRVIDLPIGEKDPVTWNARSGIAVGMVGNETYELHVVEGETGKLLVKIPCPGTGMPSVGFCSGDRDKFAVFCQNTAAVVSVSAGKAVRSISLGDPDQNPNGAISPDGRLLAVTTTRLCVWEVATGKKRFEFDDIALATDAAFSPDGRQLAAWGNEGVVLYDVRLGTVVRRWVPPGGGGPGAVQTVCFSPDAKRIAVGCRDGTVHLCDAATGETLVTFDRHEHMVSGLTFSADGKRLISTSHDGTALVWDVTVTAGPRAPVAPVGGMEEAGRLLGSPDAAQAQRALDFCHRNPAEAVKWLGEKVPVPAAVPPAKIAALVADLDSDDYQTRRGAARDLEAIGGEAVRAVRTAAEKSASPEVRKAAAEILNKLEGPATKPDDLRVLRAVEVLEAVATPDARAVLAKWAAGPPDHRQTTEAAAAVARLKANR